VFFGSAGREATSYRLELKWEISKRTKLGKAIKPPDLQDRVSAAILPLIGKSHKGKGGETANELHGQRKREKDERSNQGCQPCTPTVAWSGGGGRWGPMESDGDGSAHLR
jgi:hypothetical protein